MGTFGDGKEKLKEWGLERGGKGGKWGAGGWEVMGKREWGAKRGEKA